MDRSVKCYVCTAALSATTVYAWAQVSRLAGYELPEPPLLVLAVLLFGIAVLLLKRPPEHHRLTAAKEAAAATREGRLRRVLLNAVGEDDFVSWFNAMEFEGFDGRVVRVSFPVQFLRNHVENNFKGKLLDACKRVFTGVTDVELVVRKASLT